jgi:hypothetical protein
LLAEMDLAHQQAQTELDRLRQAVLLANEHTSPELTLSDLIDLSSRYFADIDGSQQPLLEADEVAALSIGRGCLSEQERKQMESHVIISSHPPPSVDEAYNRFPRSSTRTTRRWMASAIREACRLPRSHWNPG